MKKVWRSGETLVGALFVINQHSALVFSFELFFVQENLHLLGIAKVTK